MLKNKKIKVLLFLALVVMILTFTGCANTNNNSSQDETGLQKDVTELDKIKEKGVIVMATSPDYPPFETVDDAGNVVGFDIDLANEIAKELGVEIDLKEMSFGTIIDAVRNGQVDIGISGFSITPDRLESVDMTDPYLIGGQVIVTTSDSGVNGPEDLNGEKVAVGMGSTCEKAAMTIEGAEVVSLDDFNLGFVMLENGSVKAVVADISVANDYIEKNDNFVIAGEPLTYEETAIVVKKGNDDLTEALNKIIKELKENGKIDELKSKWEIQ